jgi:hypothetical protein
MRVQTTIIDNLDNVSNAALVQLWRGRSGEGAIAEEKGSIIVLLSATPLTKVLHNIGSLLTVAQPLES